MRLAVVEKNLWATRKSKDMKGYKLLLVRPLPMDNGNVYVAADLLGAGIGDRVITVGGSGASGMSAGRRAPIDATVIAIVDDNAYEEKEYV